MVYAGECFSVSGKTVIVLNNYGVYSETLSIGSAGILPEIMTSDSLENLTNLGKLIAKNCIQRSRREMFNIMTCSTLLYGS